jgi:predicted nicotinamide N-methyase
MISQGKTVMDVGCGSGLVSMLAAKAGARRVISIDKPSEMMAAARACVVKNGLNEVVKFYEGNVDELTSEQLGLEDDEKVDVIVSEVQPNQTHLLINIIFVLGDPPPHTHKQEKVSLIIISSPLSGVV